MRLCVHDSAGATLSELLTRVDALRDQVDALRPLDAAQEARLVQKLNLEWNYHSNAIEGNTLTLGETRAFLLYGITAQGKPFRDYLDIKGHHEAIRYLEELVRGGEVLTEAALRELHRILLVEAYDVDALTPDGRPTRRRIAIGQYKTAPHHVRTTTGEMHFYATPRETAALMGDLMAWYRREAEAAALHPLVLAATFHYRFVAIHPFDDGNDRMARLLTNLILMQHGFVPVVIPVEARGDYLLALEKADAGDLADFVLLVGQELIRSLELTLAAARGEPLEAPGGLDRRIERLREQLAAYEVGE
jgi:Fic family protein